MSHACLISHLAARIPNQDSSVTPDGGIFACVSASKRERYYYNISFVRCVKPGTGSDKHSIVFHSSFLFVYFCDLFDDIAANYEKVKES